MALSITPEKDQLRTFNQLRAAAAQARLPFEKEWWLNLAFYLDEQYVEWSPEINNLRRIPRTEKTRTMPRPVVNKINHFVNQQHAFALTNRPVADVLPANESEQAASDSGVALAYCNYAASPLVANHDAKLADAVLWALVCGEAFEKWCWDPVLRKPVIIACSPFDIYLDPYAESWDNVRYIIHSRFMDKEQVQDVYGKQLTGASEKVDSTRVALLREMGNAPVLNGVTVNEIWMKPNKRHEEGVYAIWQGDQFLHGPKPIPYEELRREHQLPFTQLGVVPRPGSVHYDSHVKYLRKPQMELNKYHSQRIQIRENFANPKWWLPDELEMQNEPDNSPNQVLRGHSDVPGMKPEIIQAAAMADNNEGEWIKSEMMDSVGLHEISQGQVPGRVESSKAIELLKESDASRLNTLTRLVEQSISIGYWQLLMLAKQYETDEKMVAAYSPEGIPEVKAFKRKSADPGTRFFVRMGTGLAWSRAARTDQLLRLWEVGVLQNDPDRMLQLLDIPSPTALSDQAQDVRLARNENLVLEAEKAIMPNSWDNHVIHLREHNNRRKTQDYLLQGEEAKQRYEMHCEKHEELLVVDLKKKAAQQMISQGLDPTTGQPVGAPAPPPAGGGGQTTPDTDPGAQSNQAPAASTTPTPPPPQ